MDDIYQRHGIDRNAGREEVIRRLLAVFDEAIRKEQEAKRADEPVVVQVRDGE